MSDPLWKVSKRLEESTEVLTLHITSERWDAALADAQNVIFGAELIASRIRAILLLTNEERELARKFEADRDKGQGLDDFNEDYGMERERGK
jgi:hypothetical protein